MHDDIGLSNWFPLGLTALALAFFVGSLAVFVDSIRRPKSHFGGLGRWPYTVLAGAFAVLSVLGYISGAATVYASLLGIMVPVMLVLFVVYLLRVAFPTQKRRDERELRAFRD